MFVTMEEELQTWFERLDALKKGDKKEVDNAASVYSAIRKFDPKKKKFTIRSNKNKVKFVVRIK